MNVSAHRGLCTDQLVKRFLRNYHVLAAVVVDRHGTLAHIAQPSPQLVVNGMPQTDPKTVFNNAATQ